MIAAPFPVDEVDRLARLRELAVLDTPNDDALDALVAQAAMLTDCPMAMVTLIDADRQWFKARVGLDDVQTSRDVAFCAHTILSAGLLEVVDAGTDRRFADNPLVIGGPKIRSYAGLPITVGGYRIGALCVVDVRPRRLTAYQCDGLEDLSVRADDWLSQRFQSRGTWEDSSFQSLRAWNCVELRPGGKALHLCLR